MEYSAYSKPSPQWEKFVAKHPRLINLDQVSFPERKRIFTEIEASISPRALPDDVKDSSVSVKDFSIPARDGYGIPVRSYVPTEPGEGLSRPVLVYLHAGGFLFGDLDSGDLNCRVLSKRLDVSVLNVGYRLAPRWPFPHGLNDSYDATEWAASNAEDHLHASPTAGFFVGGISSGANFAGAIAYIARDANLSPPITGLFLSIPVCIMPDAYHLLPDGQAEMLRSMEQNANNPLLTPRSLAQIQDLYGAPPSDPRMSFLLNQDHSGLPQRVYLQICGGDPLRDEAFLWEKLVREGSGTKSKIHVYQGLPHGFWRFLQMNVSRNWLDDLVEGIKFLHQTDISECTSNPRIVIKGA